MSIFLSHHLNPNNICFYNNSSLLNRINNSVQKLSNHYQSPSLLSASKPKHNKKFILKTTITENEKQFSRNKNNSNQLSSIKSEKLILPLITTTYSRNEKQISNIDLDNLQFTKRHESTAHHLLSNDFPKQTKIDNNNEISKAECNSNTLIHPLNTYPLKCINSHIELELLFDKNMHLIKQTSISNFKSFLSKYFNHIKEIYKLSKSNTFQYKVFISNIHNKTLFKIIKLQILFYSSLLISFRFFLPETFLTQTKHHFIKITKLLSHPLYTLYSFLIKDYINSSDILKQYSYILNDFDNIYYLNYQTFPNNQNIIPLIENSLNKCIHSFKYFLSITFHKPTSLKTIYDLFTQYIRLIDTNFHFNIFIDSIINILLYTQIIHSISHVTLSSFINGINTHPPYLPSLQHTSVKYKYTLVVDLY